MARYNDPSYITFSSGTSRRPRRLLILVALVLLGAVLYYVFVRPEGAPPIWGAQAGERLRRAAALESESLYRMAAEEYAAILDATRQPSQARFEAGLRLAHLQQTELGQPDQVELTLEKIWLLAPDQETRDAIGRRLGELRGQPVRRSDLPETSLDLLARVGGHIGGATGAPADHTVVAELGDTVITMEDLLYAWRETHGYRQPSREEFEPFVHHYLDLALLADEARRQGLGEGGSAALQMRMNELVTLSRAMSERLIDSLPDPSDEQLRAYFEANPGEWQVPASIDIEHFAVADGDAAASATAALASGGMLEAVAAQFSDGGLRRTRMRETDPAVEALPAHTGLVPFLFALDDGVTTGPIQLGGAYHWFRVAERREPAVATSLDDVRNDVLFQYQAAQVVRAREALLSQLRQTRPVTFHPGPLGGMIGDVPTSATTPARPAAVEGP